MNSLVKFVCVVSVPISLMLSGCGGDKSAGNGGTKSSGTYSSPDEVFTAFKSAATKNDLKNFMACMSAKSQNEFTFGVIMMSAFLPMNYMDDQIQADQIQATMNRPIFEFGSKVEKQN